MDPRFWLQMALNFQRQGNLAQAEQHYNMVLQVQHNNADALHLLGTVRIEQGRVAEGIEMIGKALKLNPGDFGALNNYGSALLTQGRTQEALTVFDRVLAIRSDIVQPHYCRGLALAALKRFDEAAESYNRALKLDPRFVPALDSLGIALSNLGRFFPAVECFSQALALQPDHFGALYNRGAALAGMEKFGDAMGSYDAALALRSDVPDLFFSRGLALFHLGRSAEALESLDRGIALAGPSAEALTHRGQVLWELRRAGDAIASYRQALELDPAHLRAAINLANALLQEGKLAEALNSYSIALNIEPDNETALLGMGAALRSAGRTDEALACFDKVIFRNPGNADALNHRANIHWVDRAAYAPAAADMQAALAADRAQPYLLGELLHLQMYGAQWRDFESLRAEIDAGVEAGCRIVRPFVYQAVAQSPANLQACSRLFTQDQFPAVAYPPIPERERSRIRIGYLSGEFREHATAYLAAGLFESHDRASFEVFAIDSGGSDGSPMRGRLEGAFDRIIDISRVSDFEAANMIRGEGIDILVNLTGYFGRPRMGVFAQRAAPVQVNYLGFPATLGASYIDYILADPIVIREDEERFYDEKVVYLPGSYQINDARRCIDPIPSRNACGLPQDALIFANFNQAYKLTPAVFGSWMRILKGVDNSILWLLESPAPFAENLIREAAHHGIAGERLVFAPRIPMEQHLARLALSDLFLDTLPYNAHTTASDALWAGVPLITCEGTTFPGRVGASLLAAAGLPGMVTKTADEFEALAIALARDPGRLKQIRAELAKNRSTCALFDTDLSRRHIEAAYRTMWDIWRKGEGARSFHV